MNASHIAIYMRHNSGFDLSLLQDLVSEGGFQLQNQQSGNITLIDEEGQFHATELSSLDARVRRGEDARFQFWESSWSGEYPGDLYCRVVFKQDVVVVEFGELPRELDSLLRGLWERICRMLDEGQLVGFVADLSGVTEEYADWDAFFVDRKPYEGPCPDILCVERAQEERVSVDCDTHRREIRGHYITIFGEQVGHILQPRS